MFSVFGAQMNRMMNNRRNQKVSVYSKLDHRKKVKRNIEAKSPKGNSSQILETAKKSKKGVLNREVKRIIITLLSTLVVLVASFFIIKWVIAQIIYINS